MNSPIYEPNASPQVTVLAIKVDSEVFILRSNALTKAPDGSVVKGDDVIFEGALLDVDTGEGVWNATVHLYDAAKAMRVASAVTDAYGSFTFPAYAVSTTPGVYTFRAEWDGDAYYNPDVGPGVVVTVEARSPVLTLGISPRTVLPGGTILWSGDIYDPKVTTYPLAGKPITLQESLDGVAWSDVDSVITDTVGHYSDTYSVPTTPGTYYYRSFYPGGSPEFALSRAVVVQVLSPTYESRRSEEIPVDVVEELPKPIPWWLYGLAGVIVGVPIAYFLVSKKA